MSKRWTNDCPLIFRQKLGFASFLCEVTYLVKTLCYSVKFIDYLCELIDFVSDSVLKEMLKSEQKSLIIIKQFHQIQIFSRAQWFFKKYRNDVLCFRYFWSQIWISHKRFENFERNRKWYRGWSKDSLKIFDKFLSIREYCVQLFLHLRDFEVSWT